MATNDEIKTLFLQILNDLSVKRARAIDSWSASKKVNIDGFTVEEGKMIPPWVFDACIDRMIMQTKSENPEEELVKFYKTKLFELNILKLNENSFIELNIL